LLPSLATPGFEGEHPCKMAKTANNGAKKLILFII